jgi:hypothetical protein
LSHITDPQAYEVAAAEFAVQGQIEKGELSDSLGELEADADCPDLLEAQRVPFNLPACPCSNSSSALQTDLRLQ